MQSPISKIEPMRTCEGGPARRPVLIDIFKSFQNQPIPCEVGPGLRTGRNFDHIPLRWNQVARGSNNAMRRVGSLVRHAHPESQLVEAWAEPKGGFFIATTSFKASMSLRKLILGDSMLYFDVSFLEENIILD
jgi:hypothetical protein